MYNTSKDIQKLIENSIFEAIRLELVSEGYLPDSNLSKYSNTPEGLTAWQNDLNAIQESKGFAVEVFGHSSFYAKGLKRIPRIVIIPRRIMPGDIGTGGTFGIKALEDDPNVLAQTRVDYNSSILQIDVNILSSTAQQDRFLNYILAKALGVRKFIPIINKTEETFLIQRYNMYDLPDTADNIEEKAYSYEVPDIWLYEEYDVENTSLIKAIEINHRLLEKERYENDGALIEINEKQYIGEASEFINRPQGSLNTEAYQPVITENNLIINLD